MHSEKKKPSKKAIKAMKEWQDITGFEFMHEDEYLEGQMSFTDAWYSNVSWLEGLVGSASHLQSATDARMEELDDETVGEGK